MRTKISAQSETTLEEKSRSSSPWGKRKGNAGSSCDRGPETRRLGSRSLSLGSSGGLGAQRTAAGQEARPAVLHSASPRKPAPHARSLRGPSRRMPACSGLRLLKTAALAVVGPLRPLPPSFPPSTGLGAGPSAATAPSAAPPHAPRPPLQASRLPGPLRTLPATVPRRGQAFLLGAQSPASRPHWTPRQARHCTCRHPHAGPRGPGLLPALPSAAPLSSRPFPCRAPGGVGFLPGGGSLRQPCKSPADPAPAHLVSISSCPSIVWAPVCQALGDSGQGHLAGPQWTVHERRKWWLQGVCVCGDSWGRTFTICASGNCVLGFRR